MGAPNRPGEFQCRLLNVLAFGDSGRGQRTGKDPGMEILFKSGQLELGGLFAETVQARSLVGKGGLPPGA